MHAAQSTSSEHAEDLLGEVVVGWHGRGFGRPCCDCYHGRAPRPERAARPRGQERRRPFRDPPPAFQVGRESRHSQSMVPVSPSPAPPASRVSGFGSECSTTARPARRSGKPTAGAFARVPEIGSRGFFLVRFSGQAARSRNPVRSQRQGTPSGTPGRRLQTSRVPRWPEGRPPPSRPGFHRAEIARSQ